jgi:nickel transport protein
MHRAAFLLLSLITAVITASIVSAHGVNLFCYIEGDTVHGEGYFSHGDPVQKAAVQIYNAENDALLATAKTDKKGAFSAPIGNAEKVMVVLTAGPGHRTDYLLSRSKTSSDKPSPGQSKNGPEPSLDYERLRQIIHQEIEPVRDNLRRLERQQERPDISTVVGGIGWIVGIFSLLYLLRKKNAS